MSASLQKQKVTPTWDLKKIQETNTRMVSHKIAGRMQCIENHPGKEIENLEKHTAQLKADLLKERGVKTPLDLVQHLAEIEVNMFGADASIEGNDQSAILFNEKPVMWTEAKKLVNMDKEQEKLMHRHYKQWMEDLAKEFGFKAQVDIAPDGNSSKIAFTRK